VLRKRAKGKPTKYGSRLLFSGVHKPELHAPFSTITKKKLLDGTENRRKKAARMAFMKKAS
jgi:hypothetical protein